MVNEDYTQLRTDVTALNQDVALIQQDLAANNSMTEKILIAVEGNGGPGLKTQAELNKAAIKAQGRTHKTAMAWVKTWIGLISAAIISMAVFAIRGMVLK